MDSGIVFAALMPHAPILVPGVGRENLEHVGQTVAALRTVARRALAAQPDGLILLSPHSPRHGEGFGLWYDAHLKGSLARFGSASDQVDLPLDARLALEVEERAAGLGVSTWHLSGESLDHGAVVPLHYLCAAGWEGPTLVIGLGNSGNEGLHELGGALRDAARELGRRVALIASGDMSHRLRPDSPCGYDPDGRRFDTCLANMVTAGHFLGIRNIDTNLRDNAAEDAVDTMLVALSACAEQAAGHHEWLSYEGPFGVGYGVAILYEPRENTPVPPISRLAELPQVARRAIEAFLHKGPRHPCFDAAGETARRGAVFVTLHSPDGRLRGCCGVTAPTERDLVHETWRSALAAAFSDHRFPKLEADELSDIHLSVTVLGELEPIESPDQLAPEIYGVLMTSEDGRRGLLLPDLPGIDTVERQLEIARQKAGIDEDEPVSLQRFTAQRYEEA